MMHHAFNFGLGQDPGPNQGPGLGNGGGQLRQQQWNLQAQNRSKYLKYNKSNIYFSHNLILIWRGYLANNSHKNAVLFSFYLIVLCM